MDTTDKTRAKAKETVLVITVGFLAIALVTHRPLWQYLALATGLAGALSTALSIRIDWLWSKLSQALGFISNTVLLTIVFITIVTPVALLRKRRFRFNPKSTTNLVDRDHLFTREDFEKTF